jgi:3-methyladenine DNA glycosylase/8-oxoguanine DNA glycosylase
MKYWSDGIRHIQKIDPIFYNYGSTKKILNINKSAFEVLFNSICSQQISTSAAQSIQTKSKLIFKKISMTNFNSNLNKIDKLPITGNKKKCLISLINYLNKNKSVKWRSLSDQEVHNLLINVFGIGPWTIQMFNIFYRGSSDIIPLKDIGFINSYKKYYNDPTLEYLNSYINKWSPYGTIITMNLWLAYDGKSVDL